MTRPILAFTPLAAALSLILTLAACAPERAVRVRAPEQVQAEQKPDPAKAAELAAKAQTMPAGITDFVLPEALEAPTVYSADVLPASMLSGPLYTVAPEVELKGQMAAFKIKSEFGRLDADSVEIVQQRIAELSALAELERMSDLGVFGKAAGTSLKRTGKAVLNVFRDPAGTAKAIPEGIRRKVSRAWASIKLGGKEISDSARSKIRGDEAPPEFNAFLPDPPTTPERTWEDRAQSQGTKFGLDYIGYNRSRRELTKELAIDPYTSNPEIEDRLDAFAWSYLAGGATTGIAMTALTGGASIVLSKSRQINGLVYELPPEDLKKRNLAELDKIGISGEIARNFAKNSTFTPTMQTEIVDEITAKWELEGWKELVQYLRFVDSELEARFIINALRIGAWQNTANPVKRVFLVGVTPCFELEDRSVLVPAPVDYLHYNAKFKAFLGEPQLRSKVVRLSVSGKISEAAERAIAARGWQVDVGQQFPGSPAYAQ